MAGLGRRGRPGHRRGHRARRGGGGQRPAARLDEELPGRCPPGCPADLREFIEHARQLPAWADTAKLKAAVDFNKKRGTYLGVAYGFVSGMMSTVIPHEARAVYYSKGGADMKRRISRTAKFGYDIGSLGGFHDPNGEMASPPSRRAWRTPACGTCCRSRRTGSGVADEDTPISQRDILVTWHSLPTSVMRSMTKWGVKVPAAEADAFLHSWQVAAHMLGVRDEYIPATWAAADAQAPEILDPVLAPTPEGIKLADILLDLAADADGGVVTRPLLESLTRYFLGDQIAEWLHIPRHPGQDELLAAGWPQYVRGKEAGLLRARLARSCTGRSTRSSARARSGTSREGEPLSIEIPDANNPNYS